MRIEEIKIRCADHVELAATIYAPVQYKGAVMIGPATGIRRKFYHAFASYLATCGYGIISFDNRGIGDSLAEPLPQSKASLQSWGELDMPAVLKRLKLEFPNTDKYHLIGHSAGGQLVGLMENCHELSTMFNFASSSGSLKRMKYPYKFKAIFFMDIFIPLCNRIYGYSQTQWLGMGDPLPKLVAGQWRKWCNGDGYVKTDFNDGIKKHYYNELSFPTFWLNATDDDIAINENVQNMIEVFPNIEVTKMTLDPKQYHYKSIGHMQFFTKQHSSLWAIAKDWLDNH